MIGFAEVHAALIDGRSVRRKRWEPTTILRITNGQLVQYNATWKHGYGSEFVFDWDDMSAKDWEVLPVASMNATS